MALKYLLVFVLVVLVGAQSPPTQAAIGGTGSFAGWWLNVAGNQYMTQSSSSILWTITPVPGTAYYTITNGNQYLSALVGGTGFNSNGASQSYNQFSFTQQSDGTWEIFSQYLQSYNGYGWLCIDSTPYGPYCPYFATSPYKFTLVAPVVKPPPQASIGGTGSFAGWYLSSAGNPYLVQSLVNVWTISPVAGTSNPVLYTIVENNQFLSAFVNGNGYNSNGASQSYNQFTFTQQPDGTWYIFSPYLQSYNGYGYLCVYNTPYGPYSPYFATSPYKFTLSYSATPAPTVGVTMTKAIKDSKTGQYINSGGDPYLSSSPVEYTISPVSGQGNTWTLLNGGQYMNANPNNYGYSSSNTDSGYSWWQLLLQSNGQYILFNQAAENFNGYGFACSTSTPYGPYQELCNSAASTWTLV